MDPQMASFLEEEKRKAMFNEVRRIPIASISTRLDGFPNPDDAIADHPYPSHWNQPQVVAKLADVCFDKCVSKPGASLDRYESACLSQCALRYLETGQVIMQRISGGGMQ